MANADQEAARVEQEAVLVEQEASAALAADSAASRRYNRWDRLRHRVRWRSIQCIFHS